MRKIVAVIQPFAPRQHIYLWEDGNKVDVDECAMREVDERLLSFAHKHETFDITISTPSVFGEGIINRLKEKDDRLNISIV